jgi:hypothetical protein
MAIMDLSEENLRNLKAIQHMIYVEEAKQVTVNEALNRILRFYHKFVPYGIR